MGDSTAQGAESAKKNEIEADYFDVQLKAIS